MIIIFVEFIDQLIDYPINRASPNNNVLTKNIINISCHQLYWFSISCYFATK